MTLEDAVSSAQEIVVQTSESLAGERTSVEVLAHAMIAELATT